VGDIEVKEKLFVALNSFLAPIREKRGEFEGKDEILDQILKDGTAKAGEVAKETMKKVKRAMKINYFG
jgi:tryptophanyl-tRNA synthetase